MSIEGYASNLRAPEERNMYSQSESPQSAYLRLWLGYVYPSRAGFTTSNLGYYN